MAKHRSLLHIAIIYFTCLFATIPSYASSHVWHGISIAYGQGHDRSDGLYGGRISYQIIPKKPCWRFLLIYLEASAAAWHANYYAHKNIAIFAIAPVIRLRLFPNSTLTPYLEISTGPSVMTSRTFGSRKLGINYVFQDIIGAGFAFGKQQQYSFSIRYLHYSNFSIVEPNNGINVQTLLTFAWRLP